MDGESVGAESHDAETRRSLRDMGALLALPALWVDHEPVEIATGLLSVLFGVLQLDGAGARFAGADDGVPFEVWRPTGPRIPIELATEFAGASEPGSGIVTSESSGADSVRLRVVRVPVELPWESGLVVVSARRSTFPSEAEKHLLRVAIGQGTIAIHAARRHRRERVARLAAEELVRRQNELLRSLIDSAEPAMASIYGSLREVSRLIAEVDASLVDRRTSDRANRVISPSVAAGGGQPPLPLTRRELEVLGLLAQGLSNREIAGVMWLSDRTVERHITSVYRKIGVVRRSEATAFALRHGVVEMGSDHPNVTQ